MTKLQLASSLALLLSAASIYTACSDSDADTGPDGAGNVAGESSAGGASTEPEGQAGRTTDGGGGGGGETSAAGAKPVAGDGGTTASAGGGGANAAGADGASGAPGLPSGPCTYVVTGGASLPPDDAQFICTNGSRVLQNNGAGEFTALFGAGFFTTGNDSSTLGCSLSSDVAPGAGDIWTLGAEHPGNCELSSQVGVTTDLWKATNVQAIGDVTIKFVSATLTHGSSDPSDVYYLCTIELDGTLKGETEGASDVTISGSFEIKALPLGA